MAQISDLVVATAVGDSDEFILRQGGEDKRVAKSVFISGVKLQSLSGLTEPSSLDSVHTRTFPNVAAMVSFGWHVAGNRVNWQGYYAAGDGGSNWGVVKSGAHTGDGGSVFSIDANTYIVANITSKVNVKKFGAKGGDISSDIGPIMTKMRGVSKISEIYIPNDTFYLLSNYSYHSSDAARVRVSYSGAVGSAAIRLRNGVEFKLTKSNQEALHIKGIEWYNDDGNVANAVKANGAKMTVKDCGFYNFDIGLTVSTFYQVIKRNLFKGGRIGISDDPSAGYSNNTISNNLLTGQSECGISLTSMVGARSANKFTANGMETIGAGGVGYRLRGTTDTHIDVPYMESIGGLAGNGISLVDCNNIQVTTPRSTPPDLTLKAVRSTVTFSGGGTISGINATDNSKVFLYGPYKSITGIVYVTDNNSFVRSYDLTENLTGNFLTPGLSRIAPGVTIVRNGVGDYTVTYNIARETNRTSVVCGVRSSSAAQRRSISTYNESATGFSVAVTDPATGSLADPVAISYSVQDIRSTQI